jgi:hypothetical protein
MSTVHIAIAITVLSPALGGAAAAFAQSGPAPPVTATVAPPGAGAAPLAAPAPPYSLPWQLRPVAAATALRSDTTVAFYDTNNVGGSTVATMFLGSYKLTPNLAPLVRLGFVQNGAPGAAPDGESFVNPLLGVTYARRLASFRLAGFVGGTIPIGTGGGNGPDAGTNAANLAGRDARSGMDNAMFAVNYVSGIVGAGGAYVAHKLTVQAEVTLLQLLRVRGENTGTATDSARTNSTAGLHVGYFVVPPLSLGAEVRYQRWLTTPTRIVMMTKVPIADAAKDTLSVAFGPRGHFPIGRGVVFRPGISYARVLDKPLRDSSYNMVQVDLPVTF